MIINVFKTISLLFHFLQMLLCIFFAVFFQLLYMALLMDNCSYKLFFVGIFNSKNLPIFLLRRFMPLFIIALSTLEVNDFQPMEITPAYAGKRICPVYDWVGQRDHPRLCGEKAVSPVCNSGQRGSPPPMRGKAAGLMWTSWAVRITPAYAGKRTKFGRRKCQQRDNPRLCGEKSHFARCSGSLTGSPPRMRGKGQLGWHLIFGIGITPAYAGKRRV